MINNFKKYILNILPFTVKHTRKVKVVKQNSIAFISVKDLQSPKVRVEHANKPISKILTNE